MNDPKTLQDLIGTGKKLMPKEVARLGMQIAQSLHEHHERGAVLGHVQPTSILVSRGANGLWQARMSDAVEPATPAYMSPEQAAGLPLEVRSDLFSLGSVLYTMCTGRPPFDGQQTDDVLHKVRQQFPPAIEQLSPSVPLALIGVIEKLMAKTASDRWPSAAEVVERLDQLSKAKQLQAVNDLSSDTQEPADPWQEKSRQLLAAIGILFVLLLIPLVWYNFFAPKKVKRTNRLDPATVNSTPPLPTR